MFEGNRESPSVAMENVSAVSDRDGRESVECHCINYPFLSCALCSMSEPQKYNIMHGSQSIAFD